MSCFDLKNINSELNKVKDAIYSLPLNYGSVDLKSKFMKDRQIAKKILRSKMPLSNKSETEIDDDLNRIVYGIDIRKRLGQSYTPYISEAEYEDEADSNSEKLNIGDDGFVPINRGNPIFDDVSFLKSDIRTAAFQLGEKGQSLLNDIISLTSLLASSLPAMAALIVTIPVPNIPGALSILLIVLKSIEDFFNKIKDVLPYLDILSKLELVIGPKYYDNIQSILCNYLRIMSEVLSKISSITTPLQTVLKGKSPKDRIDDVNKAKSLVDESEKRLNKLGWFQTKDKSGETNNVEEHKQGWVSIPIKNSYLINTYGSVNKGDWNSDFDREWKSYNDALIKAKNIAS